MGTETAVGSDRIGDPRAAETAGGLGRHLSRGTDMLNAICTKCGTEFQYERVRGGRRNCDGCSRRKSMRRYKERNPERVADSHRRWRAENPEKALAASRRWRKEHADELAAKSSREWRQDPAAREKRREWYRSWANRNRDKLRAKDLEWQRNNPDKAKARNDRRRARQMQAPVSDFTAQDWRELLEEFNGMCAYCGISGVSLEREHVIPLARGGAHTKANIVPACPPCNRRKATQTGAEFLERLGREMVNDKRRAT